MKFLKFFSLITLTFTTMSQGIFPTPAILNSDLLRTDLEDLSHCLNREARRIAALYAHEKFKLEGTDFSSFVRTFAKTATEFRYAVTHPENFHPLCEKIKLLAEENPLEFFKRYLPGERLSENKRPFFASSETQFSLGFIYHDEKKHQLVTTPIMTCILDDTTAAYITKLSISNTGNALLYLMLYSGIMSSYNSSAGRLVVTIEKSFLETFPTHFFRLAKDRLMSFSCKNSLTHRATKNNWKFCSTLRQEASSITDAYNLQNLLSFDISAPDIFPSDIPTDVLNAMQPHLRYNAESHVKPITHPVKFEDLDNLDAQAVSSMMLSTIKPGLRRPTEFIFKNCNFTEAFPALPYPLLKKLKFENCSGLVDEAGTLKQLPLTFPRLEELHLTNCNITTIPQEIITQATPGLKKIFLTGNINLAIVHVTGFRNITVFKNGFQRHPCKHLSIIVDEDAGNPNAYLYQAGLIPQMEITISHH